MTLPTEIIQWVNEQSNHQLKRDGLTKGIEYAIGFAEWVKVNVWQPYNDGRWVKYGESEVFTPSELFIEYIKTINK